MILDEIVSWYQKKIGTYDKEPWEKTVELKILDGFNSGVTLKTAKLKTELIDVDLVRGSTFPKAKPKQSLTTVIRLSILRYIFLPLYAQWWVKQTSRNAFGLLFFLYMTQMINWAVYTCNVNRLEAAAALNVSDGISMTTNITQTIANNDDKSENDHIVSISELLIPMALSLLLSLIHSQIVATNIAQSGGVKCKRRRYSNASQSSNGRQGKLLRRRKKLVKMKSHDQLDNKKYTTASVSNSDVTATTNPSKSILEIPSSASTKSNAGATIHQPPSSLKLNVATTQPHYLSQLKLDLSDSITNSEDFLLNNAAECTLRKRNVKFAVTQEKQQQTSPQSVSTTSSTRTSLRGDNSSPSSNSPCVSPTKTVRIDDCVQEFYDDLISRSSAPAPQQLSNVPSEGQNVSNTRRIVGDDDGFESLNGKSSSGEDNNASPHGLRLRTNIGSNHERVELLAERKLKPINSDVKSRDVSSDETEEDGDDGDLISSPASQGGNTSNCNECTTSATEWLGITTNSDECSYSSEYDNSDDYKANQYSDENLSDLDYTPTVILNPHGTSDRISCTIWDHREIKKAQMSVLEISSAIIENVELMPETNDYIYIGIFFSFVLSLIPVFCRLCEITMDSEKSSDINYFDLPMMLWEKASFSFTAIFRFAFGDTKWERTVLIIGFLNRLCLTLILFMFFSVAERTFKQRFLYAKLFSHLTSSRRARKSNLPHFRLNKVRNIKTWLSVRSYLKKRGPQRSVDIIVSAAFIVTLLLLAFLSVEWLKDSVHLHSHLNLEALLWSSTIGIFLLRFMTLGNKIHHKYRSVSVLITEQINLYLQIEKKPKKKDELMVSNSVLKLASDLLKELETPFKISGLSANPYLFTTIKVVILSALSGVLSEMLGFKLKLHKIKIK
ncbi:protein phtf [Musca vetustissima]|uniref:protein phtf n=1 Tax=Musca vetustissima TaxID=27455 RepID=UPI002AB7D2E6|nr:protein phtf [Musca vetustissima]